MRRAGFGPGLLVAAAFIGPGTMVTASRAGAGFGLALLWAVLFSVVATAVLQEMAARVGLVTRKGLSEAIRTSFRRPSLRVAALALVALAITGGNAAYETGNLLGASLGLEILSGVSPQLWAVIIALGAMGLLASGTYRIIQNVMIAFVALMSAVFLTTAVLVGPSLSALIRGMLTPSIPDGSLLTVIALIGTTVVPYNLFLHASAVQERWPSSSSTARALAASRWDTILSVGLGGLITLALVVSATPLFTQGLEAGSLSDVSSKLEPLLGRWARVFFGLGLFAAGLTSTITAPLAAAYATAGTLGASRDMKSWQFRAVWSLVIFAGLSGALAGGSPTEAIVVAQAANGLLLPFIAVFLILVVNDREVMGDSRNGWITNLVGVLVVVVVVGLGSYQLARVFGLG
jgi:manganese transport protein